jgi:tetratricopeptide (TPR) repeat protein
MTATSALIESSVSADPSPEVRKQAGALYEEGGKLYAAGEFKAAAARFEQAYALDPDPAYLFNAAQAYRLGGACAEAARSYQKFLDEVPDPPSRDKVLAWRDAQAACARAPAGAGVRKPAELEELMPIERAPTPLPVAPHPTARGHRGLAYGAVGVGIAGLGVAGFFTWDAGYLADARDRLGARCSAAAPCDGARLEDYDDRGHRATTIAVVSYAVGGAAIATAIALFVTGREHHDPALALVPSPGGGLVVAGFGF